MKATIDRIEGNTAILISQDDEAMRFSLPVSLLPPDAKEGDILTIGIERDKTATKEVKERLSDRIERLKNQK